jgi:hypothetical protein
VEYKHLVKDVWYLGYLIMGERVIGIVGVIELVWLVKRVEAINLVEMIKLMNLVEYNKRYIPAFTGITE